MAEANKELMQEVENILLSEVDSYKEQMDVSDTHQVQSEEAVESNEDYSDEPVPNEKYRLEAAKRQQKKAEEKARKAEEAQKQLQERLARLEGRLDERYGDEKSSSDEEEIDMVSEVRSLKEELLAMKQASQKKEMKQRENIFLQQNPEALDHMEGLKDFIIQRKGFASDVVNGTVSLGEAWYLYSRSLDKEVSRSKTQDSSKVFGNSKPEPVKARGKQTYNELGDAYKILGDPNSTNKREAVKVMENAIAEDIIRQLM